ncbi:MAG: hypothetical protein QHJ73_06605 [Armatimonadota bacterium]|nr:hypothetical protein [Armatimonadota bacterium]
MAVRRYTASARVPLLLTGLLLALVSTGVCVAAPESTLNPAVERVGDPTAAPSGTQQEGTGPAPSEFPLRILNADSLQYDETTGRASARGNVVVEYRDYRVEADVLDADLEEETATFRGAVTLTTPERTLQGTLLSLNLRTRGYVLEGARVAIPPGDVGMGAAAPLYAVTARVRGVPGHIVVEQGGLTSCNLSSPHYLFDARDVDLIPGKRLKARNVSVHALGHKLLTLPGVTIPLHPVNQQSSRFVPVVGRSMDEGYYLKTAYFYVLGALVGNLRLDLMSRKGVGLGLDQPYNFPDYGGTLHLYATEDRRNGRSDLEARLDHRHRLGEFNVGFNGGYRRNALSYVAAPSSSLQTDFILSRRGASGSATDLGVNRFSNTFGPTTTGTWTARLQHMQSLGRFRGMLNLNLTDPFGSTTASAGRLSSRLDVSGRTGPFTVNLVADRIDALGGPLNFYSGLQRFPELRLSTDLGRLFPQSAFFNRALPISAELSLGNLKERGYRVGGAGSDADTRRVRTYLHLSASPQLSQYNQPLTFSLPLDFHQLVYQEDEAQWVAGANPSLTYRWRPGAQVALSYFVVRQNGFTPFQSDFFGETNRLSLNATLGSALQSGYPSLAGYGAGGWPGPLGGYGSPYFYGGYTPYGYPSAMGGTGGLDPAAAGKMSASFDTGYDFQNHVASDLTVRFQYQPTPHHLLALNTGYDWRGKAQFTRRRRLRDVRARLRVDYGERFQMGVGALWSTELNRLGTLRLTLNSKVSNQWHTQAILGRSASRFGAATPYTQLMLTRDLHCWEASAIYSRETIFGRRQADFRVLLSIKAFPVNKQFGVSQSGQYLTTDIGDLY